MDLSGPGDNYDLNSSHVIPALIRNMDDARINGSDTVTLWSTGSPRNLVDVTRTTSPGWKPTIDLRTGLAAEIADCRARRAPSWI